jgi:hypothetical protein
MSLWSHGQSKLARRNRCQQRWRRNHHSECVLVRSSSISWYAVTPIERNLTLVCQQMLDGVTLGNDEEEQLMQVPVLPSSPRLFAGAASPPPPTAASEALCLPPNSPPPPSRHATIFGRSHPASRKLVLVMVGLPARGKSFVAKKIARFLNWIGVETQIFNIGSYRRRLLGTFHSHDFFRPDNPAGK